MQRTFAFILTSLLLFYQSAAACTVGIQPSNAETGNAIRHYYENRLDQLEPTYRGHWVLRLYRTSGDPRYLPEIQLYGNRLLEKFRHWSDGLEDPSIRNLKGTELLGPMPLPEDKKYLLRWQALSRAPEYLAMHKLLYLTFMTKDLGLDQQDISTYRGALTALRSFPFRKYVLEPELLLYNASNMANDVYYLQALGLENLEQEFFEVFRSVHSSTDGVGDDILFENKIYGLTHLVIAATGYYQRPVAPEKFGWILDYFSQNADMILTRLKPDVVAEVGLCFLLAGRPDDPLVAQTRSFVARAWDPATGMIPSSKGTADLNKGEHRNLLAVILLTGFKQLYPGPDLGAAPPPDAPPQSDSAPHRSE